LLLYHSADSGQILGLQTDLQLNATQYSSCLAIFFAFYIASEVPSNLIIKKVSPRVWLGALTMVWGVIGMAMGFVKDYTGLLVVRAFLGTAEGGLLPGIVLYLSMMYRRQEIGFRLGIIYAAASLSGAFGGLLGAFFILLIGLVLTGSDWAVSNWKRGRANWLEMDPYY
jgi:MFS family permease